MKLNTIGHKVLTISAAALMLAACSNKDEQVATIDTSAKETTAMDTGMPDGVNTDPVEATEMMDPYGKATQMGFEMYVGADRVFFEYDSSELTSYARSILAKQADFLNHFKDLNIAVEGHCDERGTRDYNLALGERRAQAVKNYLDALGVDKSRITTISYGKERPVTVGNSESSWKQNRRGVTVIG